MPQRIITPGRSEALRQGRFSEGYQCYSITKTVNLRHRVLATPATARVLMDSWNYLRSKKRIRLFAFCIMPDHFHMTLCLMPNENLSKVFEDSSKFTSHELNRLLIRHGQFWQEGFHDRRCRDENELYDLSLYLEHNPVRAGLVLRAEDWPTRRHSRAIGACLIGNGGRNRRRRRLPQSHWLAPMLAGILK
jgi:putative transposase